MESTKWAFKIDRNLYRILIALIIITIGNAVISTSIIDKSKQITMEIAEVTNPSQSALFDLSQMVNSSWRYTENAVYSIDESAEEELMLINQDRFPRLKQKLVTLSSKWKSSGAVDSLNKIFNDYDHLVIFQNEVLDKIEIAEAQDNPSNRLGAEEILQSEINPLAEDITACLAELTNNKKLEAAAEQSKMIDSFIVLMAVVLGLALVIINLVIVMTLFMNKNIVTPIMKIRKFILYLSKGELPELQMKTPPNAVGEMIHALNAHVNGLKRTSVFVKDIGGGNFNSHFEPLSEKDVQGIALLEMRDKLKRASEDEATRKWISDGLERISIVNRDFAMDMPTLCTALIKELVTFVGAQQGAVFLVEHDTLENTEIKLSGSFGSNGELHSLQNQSLKNSLIGQTIFSNEKIFVRNCDIPLFHIDAGLFKSEKANVYIFPLFTGGNVIGVIEIASIKDLSTSQLNYVDRLLEPVAASIHGVSASMLTRNLLNESLRQSDALSSQKQELAWANENMLTKSLELEQSQKELKKQQEELKIVNADLEIKAHLLEERNLAMEEARQALTFKAQQLEQSSKYKSAFLANMSHELRTPLNSILILAKLLSENKTQNLTPKQIEHARVINKSGSDLLMLINDILDLSKIESGKLEFVFEKIAIEEIATDMKMLFSEYANEKQIDFEVATQENLFNEITSDRLRLEQIIKNLVSNAIKFTDKNGKVSIHFYRPGRLELSENNIIINDQSALAIAVTDTGIGIPEEKQKLIFEAFNQADNSTSRKYGGTGLGLTISREIVNILGGEIVLKSEQGTGSTFTIYIPQHTKQITDITEQTVKQELKKEEQAKGINQTPTILSSTETKKFPDTGFHDDRDFIIQQDKVVLIIEDDINFLNVLIDYCHIYGYKAVATQQGETGMAFAKKFNPYAIILDLMLPDVDGLTVLSTLKSDDTLKQIPIHIISGLDTNFNDSNFKASSFLKKPVQKSQLEKLMMNLESFNEFADDTDNDCSFNISENSLHGKTILMADDDMRNIYALTTLIESAGANLICAYDGKEAVEKLQKNPQVDIVLMDIMMPVMNGYDAISEIRKIEKYGSLPVLAVTSKVVEGERERCREAGATDYISKPLNNDLLLNKLRFWLYQ